ncbi:Predicted arabinose efflux permease, MFS family [Seinonella peptonophila]|uniref:Predicted arabinose efflux permease, MFS family n=1 Tax=Seinonella peptonophila TaxID=112248 RepID=A0A1M5BHZ6_9BACL|nr:MFS transporter [Seinonella peptonophila]SHF42019.1 Predicted arabinose efflux permease, MFS family [Seinonella peptonophila]
MNVKEKTKTIDKHHDSQLQSRSSATMSRYMALLFATACGMAVANIYFAHPLLDALSSEFKINHSTIGIVITITQVCYALGLLLLVPLGDLLNQRRLIIGQMLISVVALVVIGIAPSSIIFFIGMATVGIFATVTQTLVAYASTLSTPTERGRIVGFVTSGVVIGLLLARTFAGVLTDLGGWRSVYLTSAALMLLIVGLLYRKLPNLDHKRTTMSYPKLLRSVFLLFVQEKILRIRGVLALLIFTSFSILWTSLVLPLSDSPYYLSHTAIGAFGFAGVAGAIAATRAGRLADRGLGQRTTGIALALLLISWSLISLIDHSLLALAIGIILLDLAVQAVHVTNQSMIFTVRSEARSRLTAAYMIFYSIGSATGSIASTSIYTIFGWNGVCLLGASVSAFAFLFWALTSRLTKQRK